MAQPTTARFGKFRIEIGDGATPEVFSAPCGFTSKSLTLTKNLEEVNIPDCADPDKVAWVGRDASSLSASVSGEGVLASESVGIWLDAFESTESVSVRISIQFATKTVTWVGKVHLSTFTPSADQGGRVTASVEMQSDGELVMTVTP
ncbi:phage tail tube protein [Xanthobacter sp. V2C-8]|uniref:phage tail tube protein n=1 Tax=Xanthobacter albus TaxID=3119929 RepID=UPI003727586D